MSCIWVGGPFGFCGCVLLEDSFNMADGIKQLRMMTYLSPGLPLGLFQTYQYYLEEVLGCHSTLSVESRCSGPLSDRPNPFDADEIDLAFMCSTSYMSEMAGKNQFMELLPAAPIHIHAKSELRPIYYADVIIHKDRADKYKEILDLKGHKWAYNDEMSLSGNMAVLVELRRLGLNASFFGHILQSGSHHNSIELVLNQTVDGASIDSSVLQAWMTEHPEYKDKLHVLASMGPLPVQPIIVNTRLPADVKSKIAEALLEMNASQKWQAELQKFNVWGFKPVDTSHYNKEDLKQVVEEKKLSLHNAYY